LFLISKNKSRKFFSHDGRFAITMAKRIRLVRHSDRTPISGTANERKKKAYLLPL